MTVTTNPERQCDYKETPYEETSWEVIDEVEKNPQFVPMDMEVLQSDAFTVDPMFEDYGGTIATETEKMFHSIDMFEGQDEDVEEQLREEIQKLKNGHDEQMQAVKEESFQQGIKEGKKQATEEHRQAQEMIHETVETLIQDMLRQVQEAIQDLEKESVAFSLEIAKKLIGSAVEINPEYIVKIVREALSHAGTAIIQRVRVSPEDLEFIEVLGVRKVIQGFDGRWDFEADSTIHSGCVVDTSAGEIDFQLDEAWRRIADQVVRVVR